jgi:hypothetical protein
VGTPQATGARPVTTDQGGRRPQLHEGNALDTYPSISAAARDVAPAIGGWAITRLPGTVGGRSHYQSAEAIPQHNGTAGIPAQTLETIEVIELALDRIGLKVAAVTSVGMSPVNVRFACEVPGTDPDSGGRTTAALADAGLTPEPPQEHAPWAINITTPPGYTILTATPSRVMEGPGPVLLSRVLSRALGGRFRFADFLRTDRHVSAPVAPVTLDDLSRAAGANVKGRLFFVIAEALGATLVGEPAARPRGKTAFALKYPDDPKTRYFQLDTTGEVTREEA